MFTQLPLGATGTRTRRPNLQVLIQLLRNLARLLHEKNLRYSATPKEREIGKIRIQNSHQLIRLNRLESVLHLFVDYNISASWGFCTGKRQHETPTPGIDLARSGSPVPRLEEEQHCIDLPGL